MPFWKKLVSSRKFWAAVVGLLVPIANEKLGLELSPAELLAAITPLIAYILGISFIEAKGGQERHDQVDGSTAR